MKADDSLLGFASEVLLSYLDFEHAREFLKAGTTEEAWNKEQHTFDEPTLKKDLAEYMDFAWDKVDNHRGISASRSVDKCSTWVWLLGDEALLARVEAAEYAQYGAPKLAVICEAYGLPVPDSESIRNMIQGMSCSSFCEMGCG